MVAAGVIAPSAAPAWAAQTRLRARADTYVDAARPHRAYGHRTILRVSSSPRRRAYLRFKVPLGGSSLTRARLRLSVGRGAGRLKVRRLTAAAAWSERRTTYARAPRAAGRAIRARVLRHAVVVDVTRFVKRGRNANLELSGGRDVRVWSRESARRPVLVVDWAPTPAPAPPPPPAPVPPAPPPGPVVAAAGDIACAPGNASFNGGLGTATACAQKRTSDLLMGGGFAAILALGDIQYGDGTLADYRASFDPTWGRVKPLIHPVLGNEDYIVGGAPAYFDYFDGVGASTGPAGARGQGWYSFDVGGWHLIALNSNCAYVTGGCAQGSPQEQWLAADLRAHPAACTLAYWHHPLRTSGDAGNDPETAALWNDLQAAGADLVLAGHAHLYERFAPQDASGTGDPNGIREFVVGTGGEDHHGLGAIQANSEVRDNDTFGVLELTLRPGGYGWRFVPEAGATFTDSGEAPCH